MSILNLLPKLGFLHLIYNFAIPNLSTKFTLNLKKSTLSHCT